MLEESVDITVYAIGTGLAKSEEISLSYIVIRPEKPIFEESYIMGGKQISLSTKQGIEEIYVSVDDSEFSVYFDPITVYDYTVIRAYSQIMGFGESEVVEYNVTMPQSDAPVPNYASGEVFKGTKITLVSHNDGLETEIYYTTDGTEPDNTQTLYVDGIVVTEPVTIKAVAYSMGRAVSDTVTLTYTLRKTEMPVVREVNTLGGKKIYLSTETADARIYYTLDCSDPRESESAILYDAPFIVSVSGTIIRVYAVSDKYIDSETLDHTVEIGRLPSPVFSINEDNVYLNTKIEIYADDFATIRYTTDGSFPDENSPVYDGPIAVEDDMILMAIATADGWQESDVTEKNYKVYVTSLPYVVKTKNGNFMKAELKSETPDAVIYYTVNGDVPTLSSDVYTTPLLLSEDTQIKAFATSENRKDSHMYEETVFVRHTAEPVSDKPSGEIRTTDLITLTANDNAKIYYTLDGTDPTEESSLYTTPLSINDVTTLKAFAVEDDYLDSKIVTYRYSIRKTANPLISFGEDILGGKTVTISCETPDSQIYYTTDGTDPIEYGVYYSEPIEISKTTYVRAIAYSTGCANSDVMGKDMVVPVAEVRNFRSISIKTTDVMNTVLSDHMVHYTLDGTTPTLDSPLYTPGTLSFNAYTIMKYFAVDYGYARSEVSTLEINMIYAKVTFSKKYYDNYVEVTLYSTNAQDVYYTINENDPQTNGVLYNGEPIIITENTTIKVYAHANEGCFSSYDQATIYVNRASAPSLNAGSYYYSYYDSYYVRKTSTVKLYSSQDLCIRYTTDGTTPSPTNGKDYSEPIEVNDKMTIKAYCYGDGCESSEIKTFSINILNVFADVKTYDVENGKTIRIIPKYGIHSEHCHSLVGASFGNYTVYYTTDGSEPTEMSSVYIKAKDGHIEYSKENEEDEWFTDCDITIKTLVVADNCVSSDVVTKTVEVKKLNAPSFMPHDTNINKNTYISLETGEADGRIYYTENGDTPTSESTLYTEPFLLSTDTQIKAIVVKEGMANSDVLTVTFRVRRVETPTLSEKMTASGKVITLSCNTENSRIYYTLNGDTPTEQSTLYEGPFKLKKNTILSFIAVNDVQNDSLVVSQLIEVPFSELCAIYLQDTQAVSGGYIEVPLSVQKNPGISAYSISLEYDNSILTPVSAQNNRGGIFLTNIDKGDSSNIENAVSLTWIGNENCYEDGELAKAVFKVADGADATTTQIYVKENGVINHLFENIDAAYIDGNVEINTSSDAIMMSEGLPSAVTGSTIYTDTKLGISAEKTDAQTLKVDITVEENSGIGAYSISLLYNNGLLSPLSAENGTIFTSDIMSNVTQPDADKEFLSYVTVMSCNDTDTTQNGTLFTVYFRIMSPIYTEQKIEFSDVQLLRVNGDKIKGTYEDTVIKEDGKKIEISIISDFVTNETNTVTDIRVEINNNSDKTQATLAIAAFDDYSKKLSDIKFIPVDLTRGINSFDDLAVKLSADCKTPCISVYLWESEASMKPLAESKKLVKESAEN